MSFRHLPCLFMLLLLASCSGATPKNLGVRDGRLTPCPKSPNCVTSFSSDEVHGIAPLKGSLAEVKAVLAGLKRVRIVQEEEHYLRAEFTSAIMRFVDDVELLAEPDNGLVQMRSASRLGYGDLGVNRKRIEEIRTKLAAGRSDGS